MLITVHAHTQFVEVKGPGDRLSNKQIVWLSRLASWGCQVEVCRVKGELDCYTYLRSMQP